MGCNNLLTAFLSVAALAAQQLHVSSPKGGERALRGQEQETQRGRSRIPLPPEPCLGIEACSPSIILRLSKDGFFKGCCEEMGGG